LKVILEPKKEVKFCHNQVTPLLFISISLIYSNTLKTEVYLVYQDNLSLIMPYIKRITKSLKDYTFNKAKPITLRNTQKLKNNKTWVVDLPSQLTMCSSIFNTSKNASRSNILQSQTSHCV